MNIFGNALKYTNKGSIVVSLALDPAEESQEVAIVERMLEITVTDTGKGISSEYLRTSLFNRKYFQDLSITRTDYCQHSAKKTSSPVALALDCL